MDEREHEYLHKLELRTKRMNSLIDGILQYSRIGRMEVETQYIDLDTVVPELIDQISPPESIKIKVEGTLPSVIYEKTLLVQIFQNLIDNAIKHINNIKGVVTISCTEQDGFWEFCIKDNGIGIEEKHFEKIFKIFQTLKPNDGSESTGIGLSLVKKIVERCGGTICVNSTVGEGSEFYFTIPKQSEHKNLYNKYTVLIIDDSIEFIKIAASMLKRENHKVLSARSANEAFQILETHPEEIHITLFDIIIPGEEALERFKKLRALRPKMKIILCTGHDQSGIIAELKKEGPDGLISKPFQMKDLYHTLLEISTHENTKENISHEKRC